MTAWTAFASVAGVVTVLLLLLSHSTSQRFGEPPDSPREERPPSDGPESSESDGSGVPESDGRESSESDGDARVEPAFTDPVDAGTEDGSGSGVDDAVESDADDGFESTVDGTARSSTDGTARSSGGEAATARDGESSGSREVRGDGDVRLPGGREQALARELSGTRSLSQPLLLVNVALSQGVFAVVLVVAAVLGDVPRAAIGVGTVQLTGWLALVGVALGVALYGANEAGSRVADAAGLGQSEDLRELLAPESPLGWVLLLGGVLPIVAGFEELLFRGVLVGAFATGFGVSPWLLVVGSSVLFGLGHGAQGRLGVLVTGALGVVLGAAFVLTDSLIVVVVAHYLVNALEFVVHEGPVDAFGRR